MSHPDDEERIDASEESSLSRRAVLAGLGTAGAAGALVGGTAGALEVGLPREQVERDLSSSATGNFPVGNVGIEGFHDSETSGDMSANVLQSGTLDLTTCWERPGEDCSPVSDAESLDFGTISPGDSGAATLRCALETNPGWVWLRTSCPGDTCGLERGLEVTVWYDADCDGSTGGEPIVAANGTELENVPLCTALSALHEGVRLDGDPASDGPAPLEAGETCCIGFEWDAGHFCGDDELEITFELFTQQRRHNPDPPEPWGDPCDVECDFDCPQCDFGSISFVAFCIEEGELAAGDVTFTPHYDFEGDAYRVDWASDVALEWVVLYYGSRGGKFFENFHYDGQETSGSVQINSPDHAYFDSRLAWGGNGDVTEHGQCPRDPCPDLSSLEYGCGVRYNFDDDAWDGVCSNACSGES